MVLGFGISVSALSRRRQTGSWLLIPNDDCGPVLGNWLLWLLTLHVSRIKWDWSKQQKNSIHPHLYDQRLLLFKVYTNIYLLEWRSFRGVNINIMAEFSFEVGWYDRVGAAFIWVTKDHGSANSSKEGRTSTKTYKLWCEASGWYTPSFQNERSRTPFSG